MDKYLIILSILLLIAEGSWLMKDLDVTQSEFSQKDATALWMGKVKGIKKSVKRRHGDSLVWEETKTEDDIYAMDSILTMDHSTAELRFDDDTDVWLQENTLITIERPEGAIAQGQPLLLKFKKGILQARSSDSSKTVEAGEWTIEIKKRTQISLQSTSDGAVRVEMQKGEAQFQGRNAQSFMLTSGQAIDLQEKNSLVKKVLQTEWVLPQEGERFYTHSETTNVNLLWKGKANHLRVSNTSRTPASEMKIPLAEASEMSLPMTMGHFVVRLEDENSQSFSRNFSVWPAPRIYLISPMIRERLPATRSIKLMWTLEKDVSQYVWQISSDQDFKNIIASGETTSNVDRFEGLGPGEYHWRVSGKDGHGYLIPPFHVNSFFILERFLDAPKLKAPKVKRESAWNIWEWILPRAYAAPETSYSAEFQWEEVTGAQQYLIEISEDPSFRKTILSETVDKASFKWKNFTLKKYYWRVAAQAEGKLGLFSEVAYADLTTLPSSPITPQALPSVAVSPSPSPQAKPSPKPSPKPSATPLAVPAAELSDVVVERKRDVLDAEWAFDLKLGASVNVSNFSGEDFKANTLGLRPGEFRFTVTPPQSLTSLKVNAELAKTTYKLRDPSQSVFQENLSTFQYRVEVENVNDVKGAPNFGLVVHNQYPIFKRDTLESLALDDSIFIGPIIVLEDLAKTSERRFSFGLFGGKGVMFENRVFWGWNAPLSSSLYFTYGIQAAIAAGYVKQSSWWYDFRITPLLGLRF